MEESDKERELYGTVVALEDQVRGLSAELAVAKNELTLANARHTAANLENQQLRNAVVQSEAILRTAGMAMAAYFAPKGGE